MYDLIQQGCEYRFQVFAEVIGTGIKHSENARPVWNMLITERFKRG
jgi:hypothetical protein